MKDRTLSIGGTINLGNFETFRLDVSATIEDDENLQGVWLDLDTQLRILQESTPDENVSKHIQDYRRRITLPISTPMKAEEKQPSKETCKITFGDRPQARDSRKPTPAPAPEAEPAPGELTCEDCGKPISETEARIGHIFTDRNLCHHCVEPYRQDPQKAIAGQGGRR